MPMIRYALCSLLLCAALGQGCAGARGVAGAEPAPQRAGGESVSHDGFTALLREHVDEAGRVDYESLREDEAALEAYIADLARVDLETMERSAQLATLLNAYNAFTLKLLLEHEGVESIRDIPRDRRWKDRRWRVGGRLVSLDELEHEWIRTEFAEARIHFALVCAAESCPPLRREAYLGDDLDAQLEEQAALVHAGERWFRYDAERNVLWLTSLYRWYAEDFQEADGSVVEFAARYSPPLRAALDRGERPRVRWMAYDWSLNNSIE